MSDKTNCSSCHNGFNFSNYSFENNGLYEQYDDAGRFRLTQNLEDIGKFKVPTLRNIAFTAPYMHDGSQRTLEEVVEHYNKGGIANPWLSDKITPLNLTAQEKLDLVEFMRACTGEFPFVASGRLPE